MNEENHDYGLVSTRDAPQRTAADVLRHVKLIEEVMQAVMKPDVHFGLIPGCGPKPALLKAGAEKLLLTFSLSATHKILQRDLGNGHREYEVLTTVKSGERTIAEGMGVCSTMESKYRYRKGSKKCPTCSKERTIIQTKGGRNPGGYWCVPDKGGCGGNFQPGDKAIEGQVVGNIDNPDLADVYNTVLKMAKKRSMVDGAISATAASDIFAQDIDELVAKDAEFKVEEAAAEAAAPKKRAAPKPVATAPAEPPPEVEILAGGTPPPRSEHGAILDEMVRGSEKPAATKPIPPEAPRTATPAPAPAPLPAAAASNGELKSMSGLTQNEWTLLTEEQRAQRKDITRKQCKLILDLAKSKGINDHKLVVNALRDDFSQEFAEYDVKELWQINGSIASYAIEALKPS